MHTFIRFEPRAGCAEGVRGLLLGQLVETRAEPGCVRIEVFESVREPVGFAIHSEWHDEAAFDLHAGLPHTRAFIAAVEPLLTHEVVAVRTRKIG